jgi:hypothetical protein
MTSVEHFLVPPWAGRIRVERSGDDLLVRGEERLIASTGDSTADADLLRDYFEHTKGASYQRRGRRSPLMHLDFANATDDAKICGFVARFGPVSASRLANVKTGERTESIDAVQDLAGLRRERRMFAGAVTLSSALSGRSKSDHQKLASGLAEISEAAHQTGPDFELRTTEGAYRHWHGTRVIRHFQEFQLHHPGLSTLAESLGSYENALATLDVARLRDVSQKVLVELLNHFPTYVLSIGKAFMELPPHERSGVLPVLYFMLRQDCLRQYGIGICAREGCGRFFRIRRHGLRFHSTRCSQLQRQREYWHKRGRFQRRRRRASQKA